LSVCDCRRSSRVSKSFNKIAIEVLKVHAIAALVEVDLSLPAEPEGCSIKFFASLKTRIIPNLKAWLKTRPNDDNNEEARNDWTQSIANSLTRNLPRRFIDRYFFDTNAENLSKPDAWEWVFYHYDTGYSSLPSCEVKNTWDHTFHLKCIVHLIVYSWTMRAQLRAAETTAATAI